MRQKQWEIGRRRRRKAKAKKVKAKLAAKK